MEPVWYFISRAAMTLIPLLLISFGAGIWLGWIKWHTWKREYHSVEQDYHKLHDIHDTARTVIPELEQHRESLSGTVQNLSGTLDEYRGANEQFQAESMRLNESLRATKRNYEALEDIWRIKLAKAELRIEELESQLQNPAPAPASIAAPAPTQETGPREETPHLILFPNTPAESASTETAPQNPRGKNTGKSKNRRAI